jgi:hypothetical protein
MNRRLGCHTIANFSYISKMKDDNEYCLFRNYHYLVIALAYFPRVSLVGMVLHHHRIELGLDILKTLLI